MKTSNRRFVVACGFVAALAIFLATWCLFRARAAVAQVQAAEARAQLKEGAAAQPGASNRAGPIVIDEPIGDEGKESMLSAALRFLIQGPRPAPQPPVDPPAAASGGGQPSGVGGATRSVEDLTPSSGGGGGVGVPPGVGGAAGPNTGFGSSGGGPAGVGGGSVPPGIGAGSMPGTTGGTGSSTRGPASGGFGGPSIPGTPSGPGMGTGGSGMMGAGGGGGTSISPLEQLRWEYETADREAHRLAEKLRASGPIIVPSDPPLRELHAAVTNAFTARQRMLRAELAELQKQVRGLENSIDTRDRAAGTIIGRRIEDMLNPNLRWDVPAAKAREPMIFKTGGSPPAAAQPGGTLPGLPSAPRASARPAALQGTWLAVEQGTNGEMRPYKTMLTLTFGGDQYEYRQGPETPYSHGTWRSPAGPTVDKFFLLELTRLYLRSAGPDTPQVAKPHVEHMIAAIEGDRLRMCTAYDTTGKPTTELTTSPDDGRILMVYRRISDKSLSVKEIESVRKVLEGELPPLRPGGSAPGKTGGGRSNIPHEEHHFDKPPGNVEGDSSLPGLPEVKPADNVPVDGR